MVEFIGAVVVSAVSFALGYRYGKTVQTEVVSELLKINADIKAKFAEVSAKL